MHTSLEMELTCPSKLPTVEGKAYAGCSKSILGMDAYKAFSNH